MAEHRSDESPRDGFEDGEFGALAEVRSALEAVEREQDGVRRERRRLREQLDSLLAALREDAVVLVFDRDRELIEASGCVRDHLGVSTADLVADFDDFVDDETVEALDEANRAVLDGHASGACVSDGFLKAGDEELATTFVHVPRIDADGEIKGIEAIGVIAPAPEVEEEEDDDETGDPFEPLLEHMARRLLADPSSGGIERAVRTFGDFLVADRVVVNQYDEVERSFSVMASWLRPGTEPLAAEEEGISISELPWAYSALGAGESIIISAGADLPREARREKELYAEGDVSSSLLVPILRHDALAGFVSVQSIAEERTWDDIDAARARLFGIILTAGLAQADAERALTQAREEAALASAARADIETALADARGEVQRLEEGRTTAESEIEALEAREASLRKELDSAREEADQARRELEEARREQGSTNTELEKLQEEAERAQRRSEDAASDALSARDELDELRERLAESERQVAELRAGAAAAARAFSSAGEADEGAADASGWSFGDRASVQRGNERDAADTLEATDDAEAEDDAVLDADPATRGGAFEQSGFDPDATIEMSSEPGRRFGFDPDATIEMDPSHAAAFSGSEAQDEKSKRDAETVEAMGHGDAEESDDGGGIGALEPTQSGIEADVDRPGRWKEDKVSWEDSTDEVPLPKFLGADEASDAVEEAGIDDVEADEEDATSGFGAFDIGDRGSDDDEVDVFERDAVEPEGSRSDVDDVHAGEPESDISAERDAIDTSSSRPWWRRGKDDAVGEREPGEGSLSTEEFDLADEAGVTGERDVVPATSRWDEPLADAGDAEKFDDAEELDDAEGFGDAEGPDVADDEDGLPTLPGVEVERGLAEVGGNVELYRNLLTKFRSDYLGAAEKIESAIDKGNIEVAHLLLHAVKGVAGVLGAERVRENADELETQLIGSDPSATSAAASRFSEALHEVLDSIDMLDGNTFALLPETAPPDSEPAEADEPEVAASPLSQVSDPLVLRSYLSGLRPHITARKPRQCMLVMREVTSRNWADDYNERLAELADFIEEGDFETATDSYQELMQRLEQV